MPRVVITTQVFPPELHPTAVMVREFASYLARHGWDVTVAAGFPHHPYGRLYDGHRLQPRTIERMEGFDVVRTWHLISPRRDLLTRSAVYATQALANAVGGVFSGRADLVLVFGPPLVGPALGWAVAQRHHAKLVSVVYDLFPDAAVAAGKLQNPALVAAGRWAERLSYWAPDKILVLSEGFRRLLIERGVPEKKLAIVPVWLDPEEIRPSSRLNAWRIANGIHEDRIVVLYAGTIGLISGARVVVEAAARLRQRKELLFLFVGEGEEKAVVAGRAAALGLENVRVLPLQPRGALNDVQATADMGLVTLLPGCGRSSVPSKMLGYMAAGRPIIASVEADSDTARQIAEAGAGIVCQPSDPVALAEGIGRLCDAPGERIRMGAAARLAFMKRFARDSVLEHFRKQLETLVA